ncbi:hypothetical protein CHH59_21630, partial [Shouchella clausii]|uniref:fibronectin type III domain-containing protein n=1 Tax=Shouchella clausii TaxID=79880 RepID=UPI000BD3B5E1
FYFRSVSSYFEVVLLDEDDKKLYSTMYRTGDVNGVMRSFPRVDNVSKIEVRNDPKTNTSFFQLIEAYGKPMAESYDENVTDINFDPSYDSARMTFTNPSSSEYAETLIYLDNRLVLTTKTNDVTFENLKPDRVYTVRVTTKNSDGDESNGVVRTFKTTEA